MAFAFSDPARPRSVVIMISATRRTGRRARSGSISSSTTAATRLSASRSSSAYGRAAMIASCARFMRDAATISIARVIWAMFRTEPIRPRMSFRLGI